jgi:catechol 2,3-dioxygenase-like lactoylglutathione lyase family enzyme
MSRVQVALNVTDIDAAVVFYEKVFGTPVTKQRPGYANFAIDEPPLKLVLIESSQGGTMNHMGVEVETVSDVNAATEGFIASGLTTYEEQGVECCYAKQDKVFVTDPNGLEWEFYTVLGDSPVADKTIEGSADTCCEPNEAACC